MEQRSDKQLQLLIAQRVKYLRKQKGVSQQQAYNDTDVHIGRIETAKLNVTVNTIAILCSYFNITLMEFFSEGFEELD